MRSKSLILLVIALVMLGCTTVYTIPIDDVYHWPGAYTSSSSASSASSTSSISSTSAPSTPSTTSTTDASTPDVEYINVQDTTVTIRIKK